MSSAKARQRKKRASALVMLVIMFGGVFTASGIIYFGGGSSGGLPSPTPPSLPVFARNLSSFDDALGLAPSGALRVLYSDIRGAEGTDLSGFINQRHTLWSQVYGSTVTAEVRILLNAECPPLSGSSLLWLHSLSGPPPRPPPSFQYRNATIIEFFPGRQPWFGFVTNTQPIIAGIRPLGPARPPYLCGLDETLDILAGVTNRTARDRFGDLARRLPPGAQLALASSIPLQGWDNRSVFGVLSHGNESYLAEVYLAGHSPNATRLQELQANASARGVQLLWEREAGGGGENGDLVRIRFRGNWTQVRDLLVAGNLLPADA